MLIYKESWEEQKVEANKVVLAISHDSLKEWLIPLRPVCAQTTNPKSKKNMNTSRMGASYYKQKLIAINI